MEKENLRTVLVIIVVSMIAILSFGLVIGQLVDSENLYETLIIIISFVGIFATFGGAYLGAKISANTAIRLSRSDKIIESSVKILTNLEEINSLRKSLYYKIVGNVLKLATLKDEKDDFKGELKEYKTEYYEWQKRYSEIIIYILNTNLKQEDIQCIEVPLFLQLFSEYDISNFTYSEKNEEGGVNIEVDYKELDQHLNELNCFQKQLLETEKEIMIIKEKIIKQFPK